MSKGQPGFAAPGTAHHVNAADVAREGEHALLCLSHAFEALFMLLGHGKSLNLTGPCGGEYVREQVHELGVGTRCAQAVTGEGPGQKVGQRLGTAGHIHRIKDEGTGESGGFHVAGNRGVRKGDHVDRAYTLHHGGERPQVVDQIVLRASGLIHRIDRMARTRPLNPDAVDETNVAAFGFDDHQTKPWNDGDKIDFAFMLVELKPQSRKEQGVLG